jgi:ribosome-binding factor A
MGHRSRRRRGDDASLVDLFFSEVSDSSSGSGSGSGSEASSASASASAERKCKQVCREVFRVLAQAEPRDPLLLGLLVMEVAPAPDASRLAVRVLFGAGTDVDAVRAALARWKGGLRAEIAQALQRKRTPELVFDVLVAEVAS